LDVEVSGKFLLLSLVFENLKKEKQIKLATFLGNHFGFSF